MASNRRDFIKKTVLTGIGLGLAGSAAASDKGTTAGKRIGMVGLDTGHSEAFTKSLNNPQAGDKEAARLAIPEYRDPWKFPKQYL